MKKVALVALMSVLCSKMVSAGIKMPDDTLASYENSKVLGFPFFLKSPETGWGFGLAVAYFFKAKKLDKEIRTSDINLVSLYTLKKQLVLVLGSTIYFPEEKNIFRWQSSFSYYPDKFWGIGNNTNYSAQEEYDLRQFYFNPQFLFRIYKKYYVGATAEFQQINNFNYENGGVFDSQNVLGRNGGTTSGVGMLFTFDTRNNAYSPMKGGFVELNVSKFDNAFGSKYNFMSYSLELKKFYRIGSNRVLGLHGFAKVNEGEVPVRNLALLGGSDMMRGYYKGRYTDKTMLTTQAEVRQYLFWRIGIVAFASAGQVGNSLSDVKISEFHYSYGGGLRIMVQEKEKLNLRIDYGRGEGRSGVYVILREAF